VDKHNRKHYLSLVQYLKANLHFQHLLVATLRCEDRGATLELYRIVSWRTLTEYEGENRMTLRKKIDKHMPYRDYQSKLQIWD
jgi:hypothetical protein